MKRRKLENSEEYILNSISLLTNILFFDLPQSSLFEEDLRRRIFTEVHPYVYLSKNPEIKVETVRVLANLSRH